MGNSIYLGGGIKSTFCGGNVKEIWQGSNKIFGGGSSYPILVIEGDPKRIEYETVIIGNRLWSTKNVCNYGNLTDYYPAKGQTESIDNGNGYLFSIYSNKSKFSDFSSRIKLKDTLEVSGFHLASKTDYEDLVNAVGKNNKNKLLSKDEGGEDAYGFNLKSVGNRSYWGSSYRTGCLIATTTMYDSEHFYGFDGNKVYCDTYNFYYKDYWPLRFCKTIE